MQSLQDILGEKDFGVPPEVEIIKSFVRTQLRGDVHVHLQAHSITIVTPSASMAGALRPLLHSLKKELASEKRIFIRIGGVK
jgi:hypothetical protein